MPLMYLTMASFFILNQEQIALFISVFCTYSIPINKDVLHMFSGDGFIQYFDSEYGMTHTHYMGGSGQDFLNSLDVFQDSKLYVVGYTVGFIVNTHETNDFPMYCESFNSNLVQHTISFGYDIWSARLDLTYVPVPVEEG